jgi:hypothetical protein
VKRINRFIARFGPRFVFARDRAHNALITKAPRRAEIGHSSGSDRRELFVLASVFGPHGKPKGDGLSIVR